MSFVNCIQVLCGRSHIGSANSLPPTRQKRSFEKDDRLAAGQNSLSSYNSDFGWVFFDAS